MFDYVLFDLDGTLTRSGDGIKKSAAHAIAHLGYPPLTDEQLDTFVGPPLLESFMAMCGMDEHTALQAVEFTASALGAWAGAKTPSMPASRRCSRPCARRGNSWPWPRQAEVLARRIVEHFAARI